MEFQYFQIYFARILLKSDFHKRFRFSKMSDSIKPYFTWDWKAAAGLWERQGCQ